MEDNVDILNESYSAFRIYKRLSIFNTLSADAEIDSQFIDEKVFNLINKYPVFFKSKYDNQIKVASDEEISELLGMEA